MFMFGAGGFISFSQASYGPPTAQGLGFILMSNLTETFKKVVFHGARE